MKRRKFLESGLLAFSGAAAGSLTPATSRAGVQPGQDYFRKMADFDSAHINDVVTPNHEFPLLKTALSRIKRVQVTVGYGNFNVLGFDDMLKMARSYPSIERFDRGELEFIEKLFHIDASLYGFHGTKLLANISDDINLNRTVSVRGTGQRIYRGPALEKYRRIKKAIGKDVVLTSGVRSLVKQLYLFMNKAARSNGNLSLASRSLAPPGYSFHAVGDFDVGKRGLGRANFTQAFADTDVYKRLLDLGFVRIRYPQHNLLGVRFEPWHVRVF